MAAWHPRLVGAFVVAGVALLVAAILLLNRDSLFSRKWTFVAWFSGSVNGLAKSSPVKMRGIEIGRVKGVYLSAPNQTEGLEILDRVPVVFEVDERLLGTAGIAPRLAEPERLARLIEDGLRAELKLESFVTGQQYVSLDFRPGTPAVLVKDRGLGYEEIPTVPPPLESVQEDVAAVLSQIRAMDVKGVVDQLIAVMARIDTTLVHSNPADLIRQLNLTLARVSETIASVDRLLVSVDSSVRPIGQNMTVVSDRLRGTLDSLDLTMRTLRTAVDPTSPLSVRMADSFREMAEAANAMRRLAEVLERDPSTLVRGRAREK